jgi:integrase
MIKISKIKTDDIKQLSEELKKKPAKRGAQSKAKKDASPLNPRTVKKQTANLRALFNWAIKEGYLDKNPVIIKNIIKTDDNEAGRVLSDDELAKLWNLDEFILKPRLLVFLKANIKAFAKALLFVCFTISLYGDDVIGIYAICVTVSNNIGIISKWYIFFIS